MSMLCRASQVLFVAFLAFLAPLAAHACPAAGSLGSSGVGGRVGEFKVPTKHTVSFKMAGGGGRIMTISIVVGLIAFVFTFEAACLGMVIRSRLEGSYGQAI